VVIDLISFTPVTLRGDHGSLRFPASPMFGGCCEVRPVGKQHHISACGGRLHGEHRPDARIVTFLAAQPVVARDER